MEELIKLLVEQELIFTMEYDKELDKISIKFFDKNHNVSYNHRFDRLYILQPEEINCIIENAKHFFESYRKEGDKP